MPNRYKDGDTLKIDVANRAVYLNDVETPNLHTVGNDWEGFALAPGDTTIDLISSSWADMYDCTVELREAYV
ncbi:phage distal tail protein [Lacticaseibacillus daqingensis]|uniref:phage distal tail protein n=1 Tax=Lacticaseibacillus daqingensis TaxID=2486014 RepID=UPI00385178AC